MIGMVRRCGTEAGWRWWRTLWAGLLCLIASAATSSAQVSGTTATLRGAVDDASGGVLQGATITLVNTATLATGAEQHLERKQLSAEPHPGLVRRWRTARLPPARDDTWLITISRATPQSTVLDGTSNGC